MIVGHLQDIVHTLIIYNVINGNMNVINVYKKEYPKSLCFDRSKKNYLQKKDIFSNMEKLVIVTPSEWLANIIKESFLREYPIKVINNGIDLSAFKPLDNKFRDRYGLKNKFIILGIASVWGERKGLNYFINISQKLKSDECIVLVGVTEKQKAQLPKNVIGITRTNNVQELAEIYTNADVFLNPTLEDNFPTTNLESLACGTPLIVFNTGGNKEIISKETGFVVEKYDDENVRKCIDLIKNR